MKEKYYKNSLKFKVWEYIQQRSGNIILRSEIASLASPRQISRCLKDLETLGYLIKIGYGVYAKSYISEYQNKPIIKNGFDIVVREALTKLGVIWEPGTAEREYNAGISTQVPVRTIVRLKSRYRGHLTYGSRKLIVEKGINAR
jgi:hypothetical protein